MPPFCDEGPEKSPAREPASKRRSLAKGRAVPSRVFGAEPEEQEAQLVNPGKEHPKDCVFGWGFDFVSIVITGKP